MRYTYNLKSDFDTILSERSVKRIYLPHPHNTTEENILDSLRAIISEYKTEIILYDENDKVLISGAEFTLLLRSDYGESAICAYNVSFNDKDYAYISAGVIENASQAIYNKPINESDILLIGSYGKKYKKKNYLNIQGVPEAIYISCENLYLTHDDFIELTENGCVIKTHPLEKINFN